MTRDQLFELVGVLFKDRKFDEATALQLLRAVNATVWPAEIKRPPQAAAAEYTATPSPPPQVDAAAIAASPPKHESTRSTPTPRPAPSPLITAFLQPSSNSTTFPAAELARWSEALRARSRALNQQLGWEADQKRTRLPRRVHAQPSY